MLIKEFIKVLYLLLITYLIFLINLSFYLVQDEDDSNRIMVLLHTNVKRLDHQNSHLKRGDEVLAVFPETTSFYPAIGKLFNDLIIIFY